MILSASNEAVIASIEPLDTVRIVICGRTSADSFARGHVPDYDGVIILPSKRQEEIAIAVEVKGLDPALVLLEGMQEASTCRGRTVFAMGNGLGQIPQVRKGFGLSKGGMS